MRKRLVLSLDGTWNSPNNAAEREDHTRVIKPSNPLKLVRAVRPVANDGAYQITYYDSGVGSLNKHPGPSNRLLYQVDRTLGGVWGAGFEGNIEDAFHFIAHNFSPGDEVFVFGFSRGASQARGLCRFLQWMGGVPVKGDAYWIPRLFQYYLEHRGEGDATQALKALKRELQPFQPVSIAFLGVWDTVMSLGSRFKAKKGTTGEERAFHVGASPPSIVQCARQALAIDERRYDFRPEVWRKPAYAGQSLQQQWFAGVHSNVGGGYVKDGLANCALEWMLDEAESIGLELEGAFLSHYRSYFAHRLYKSWTLKYRLLEARLWIRGKFRKAGVRALVPQGTDARSAGIQLHGSVLQRLTADPSEHRDLDGLWYRPKNLLPYLVRHREHDAALPSDVLEQVENLRGV